MLARSKENKAEARTGEGRDKRPNEKNNQARVTQAGGARCI